MRAVTQDIFDYKSPFLLNALRQGMHKSRRQSAEGDFYRQTPFLADPNPTRIDLASSVKDPFETVYVKTFRQHSRLDVCCLVDGSDSMRIHDKVLLAAACEASIAGSVLSQGDSYAGYVMGKEVMPVSEQHSLQRCFSERRSLQYSTAESFAESHRLLPKRSGLIFLISDFHWSAEKLSHTLALFAEHFVVPVVLWQSAETAQFPLWRFVQTRDSESGNSRLIFVTRQQKLAIETAYQQRRELLQQQFQCFRMRPLWLLDHYTATQMRRYFYGA